MSDLLQALKQVLDEGEILTKDQDVDPYRRDEACQSETRDLIVLRPASTKKVSKILEIFHQEEQPITTRGGGTGLAGGAVPDQWDRAFILSTERLNTIRSVDPIANMMVAEAGVSLQRAKDIAAEQGRDIAIAHGAVGSSTIGGNVATNAGGINVICYGMARDQVIGVEAVLADGQVIKTGSQLEKSNAGYDLGRMMIGSEGTLGIITAVTLKMRALQSHHTTALLACTRIEDAMNVLKLMRDHVGDGLSAFELMSQSAVHFASEHADALSDPLASSPWMVLVEASSSHQDETLDRTFHTAIENASEREIIQDGVIAQSETQRNALWGIRDGIAEGFSRYKRPFMRTDTAVPVFNIPEFVHQLEAHFGKACPEAKLVAFGHAGDGNIHVNLLPPGNGDDEAFASQISQFAQQVESIVLGLEGTISAEHGVGRTKREALSYMMSAGELALMHSIKQAFDPKGILNPGAVFPMISQDKDM